jgi:hypothetical protein
MGEVSSKTAPVDWNFDIVWLCVIFCLASCIDRITVHMNRLRLCKVIEWNNLAGKLPSRRFFIINSPKSKFLAVYAQNRIRFAGLHCLRYGWLKSVEPFCNHSARHLNWKSPIPAPKRGDLRHKSPTSNCLAFEPIRHILGSNHISWSI